MSLSLNISAKTILTVLTLTVASTVSLVTLSASDVELEQRHAQHFDQLDSNHDGQLSKAEAANNKRLLADFDKLDSNHDNLLSKAELQAGMVAMAAEHKAEFERRFKEADKNGDGQLSQTEASTVPHLARHFDQFDRNHDGQLSNEEITQGIRLQHRQHDEMKSVPAAQGS